jgi:autotransporter-associated beta strand protein
MPSHLHSRAIFADVFRRPAFTFVGFLRAAALVVIAGGVSPSAYSQTVVGLNFVGGSGSASVSNMGSGESAGVVSQINWNNLTGATGSSSSLVNGSGSTVSGLSISYSSTNTWADGGVSNTAGNNRLMRGYLDQNTDSAVVSVSVSGLGFGSGIYDIYVYNAGDGNNRTGNYTIGSQTYWANDNATFSGSFTQATGDTDPGSFSAATPGNYMVFSSVMGSGFTLEATGAYSNGDALRAPVNAIQIVEKTNVLYWDRNGTTAGTGSSTTGNWNTSDSNWNTNAAGTASTAGWTQDSIAVFSAGTDAPANSTITLNANGNMRVDAVIVEEGDITITAGNNNRRLEFSDATPDFIVAAGSTANVAANIAGTNGLTKSGDGTLILSTRTKTYTGTTTVNDGILQLNSSNMIANASDLVIGSGGTFQFDWGTLSETVGSLSGSGTLDLRNSTFITSTAADTTFSGVIADSYGTFRKAGTGTLTLTGNNTYTGLTYIDAGALVARSNTALGGSTSGNVIANNAALHLGGGVTVTEGSFSVQGTGVGGTGAIRNLDGANTLAATLNLANNTTIINAGGTLTVSGSVAQGARILTVQGGSGTTFSGDLQGTGAFTQSSGTVTFAGTTANSRSGATNINGGVLQLGKSDGVNAIAAGAITVANGATLRLLANEQIADSNGTFTLNAGSTFELNNFKETLNIIAGAGTIDLGATGHLALGVNSSNSTFSGDITGTGILEKLGTGTLTFNSNIDFNGEVRLNAGAIALNGNNLTADTLRITGNSVINFNGSSDSILTVETLIINAGATLTIQNWANTVDFFFATYLTGATADSRGTGTAAQIVFAGYSGSDTIWQSYDGQITPVPEPAAYGALFLALATGGYLCQRRRRA